MIRFLSIWIAGLFLFVACSRDDDDLLEGKWQLQQVESEGVTLDVDTIFYNFQTSLFMYQVFDTALDTVYHNYGFKEWEGENRLVLSLTTVNLEHPASEFLMYTDWDGLTESFAVERLTSKQLVLNRNEKRYIFRKF